MRWVGGVVIVFLVSSACATTNEDIANASAQFGKALFCPEERVQATDEGALEVHAPARALPTSKPWVEPEPPAAVAEDPARLALWRTTQRDPAYAAWERQNAESDPKTSSIAAAYREQRVVAVRGCGATQLFACSTTTGRYHRRTCARLDELTSRDDSRVACRSGGALRATGTGERTRFECATTESPEAEPLATLETCRASCTDDTSCDQRCNGSDFRACEVTCRVEASRCREGCTKTEHDALDTAGLCGVGLCDGLVATEHAEHEQGEALAKVETEFHQRVATAARIREEATTLSQCENGCRTSARGSAPALVGCVLACVKSSRASCESFAPSTSWCEAFRVQEKAIEERARR